jgi:hypothetical protein
MFKYENSTYSIKISIKYQTNIGQNIYIFGSLPELGNWKEKKFKLKWNEGHIWKGVLTLPKEIKTFSYKFVCLSDDGKFKRWEDGPNRIFFVEGSELKTSSSDDSKYKLECIWEHFYITFNIFYPSNNESEYMQLIGEPACLGSWFKNGGLPIRMSLSEPKTIGCNIKLKLAITGKFWEAKVLFPSNIDDSYEFEYRYSLYNPIKSIIYSYFF